MQQHDQAATADPAEACRSDDVGLAGIPAPDISQGGQDPAVEGMTDRPPGAQNKVNVPGMAISPRSTEWNHGRPPHRLFIKHIHPDHRLDARYSTKGVRPDSWPTVEQALGGTELFWSTSVRPSGGTHMTPLIGVFADVALHFCTGPEDQRPATSRQPGLLMSTGANALHAGLDIAIEGTATPSPTTPGSHAGRRVKTSTAPTSTSMSPTACPPLRRAGRGVPR